jgi:hypothetical protein
MLSLSRDLLPPRQHNLAPLGMHGACMFVKNPNITVFMFMPWEKESYF